MSQNETALIAIADLKNGEKLYQRRARLVLPTLVLQAEKRESIYYSELAKKVGISNPRNLNCPLGCIGRALKELGEKEGTVIPPINSLVINVSHKVSGEGFEQFLAKRGLKWNDLNW